MGNNNLDLLSESETSLCIQKAYENLSSDDKLIIDKLTYELECKLKEKWNMNRTFERKLMFGRVQALEILAKLGILAGEKNEE